MSTQSLGNSPDLPAARRNEGRFPPEMLYAAAQMYYEQGANQASIAARLGTSRATVSRLIAEARRQRIVRIDVIPPARADTETLAGEVARALSLDKVHLSESPLPPRDEAADNIMGSVLAPAVGRALLGIGLLPGDVLLVSSGRTVFEVSEFDLPSLPGVIVAPTIGGTDQPEAWYQPNEIVRRVAERIGGRPVQLFAPALPTRELLDSLYHDPAIQRVVRLWPMARCLLTGVGAPPSLRREAPLFVDMSSELLTGAIGDVLALLRSRRTPRGLPRQ